MKLKHTVRNTLLLAAITGISVPLFATAAVLDDPNAQAEAAVEVLDLNDERDRQELYNLLKDRSREICGSTNLHVTGSIERSVGNEECYQGTLTAAVERVDNEALTELHRQ